MSAPEHGGTYEEFVEEGVPASTSFVPGSSSSVTSAFPTSQSDVCDAGNGPPGYDGSIDSTIGWQHDSSIAAGMVGHYRVEFRAAACGGNDSDNHPVAASIVCNAWDAPKTLDWSTNHVDVTVDHDGGAPGAWQYLTVPDAVLEQIPVNASVPVHSQPNGWYFIVYPVSGDSPGPAGLVGSGFASAKLIPPTLSGMGTTPVLVTGSNGGSWPWYDGTVSVTAYGYMSGYQSFSYFTELYRGACGSNYIMSRNVWGWNSDALEYEDDPSSDVQATSYCARYTLRAKSCSIEFESGVVAQDNPDYKDPSAGVGADMAGLVIQQTSKGYEDLVYVTHDLVKPADYYVYSVLGTAGAGPGGGYTVPRPYDAIEDLGQTSQEFADWYGAMAASGLIPLLNFLGIGSPQIAVPAGQGMMPIAVVNNLQTAYGASLGSDEGLAITVAAFACIGPLPATGPFAGSLDLSTCGTPQQASITVDDSDE